MEIKNILPCEVVQDLLPSYIDGLTSEVTCDKLKEHLSECEKCTVLYKLMKEDMSAQNFGTGGETKDREASYLEAVSEADQREIDFLKKNRRRSRFITTSAIATVVVLIIVAVCALILQPYVVKHSISYKEMNAELSVSDIKIDNVNVRNGLIRLKLRPYGKLGISDVKVREQDGIVNITVLGAKEGPWTSPEYDLYYNSGTTITCVQVDGVTIWENGIYISSEAIALFESRHPYIGNMPDNGKTADALDVPELIGSFKNELFTKDTPYGWKLLLEHELESGEEAITVRKMKYDAIMMISVIDNLSFVEFEYVCNGTTKNVKVTEEEWNERLEHNVKYYAASSASIQELMDILTYTDALIENN